jgi:hypothetical protein
VGAALEVQPNFDAAMESLQQFFGRIRADPPPNVAAAMAAAAAAGAAPKLPPNPKYVPSGNPGRIPAQDPIP